MMRYSVQGYGFLTFVNNMGKTIGKNVSKNLSVNTGKKPVDHAKQSAADAFKTASKRAIQKTAEASADLIGNKITDRILKVPKNSQQNNSETLTNQNDKEMPKERYISIEKKKEIIDDLRLK